MKRVTMTSPRLPAKITGTGLQKLSPLNRQPKTRSGHDVTPIILSMAAPSLLNRLACHVPDRDRSDVHSFQALFDRLPVTDDNDGEAAWIDVLLRDPRYIRLSDGFDALDVVVVVVEWQSVQRYGHECGADLL